MLSAVHYHHVPTNVKGQRQNTPPWKKSLCLNAKQLLRFLNFNKMHECQLSTFYYLFFSKCSKCSTWILITKIPSYMLGFQHIGTCKLIPNVTLYWFRVVLSHFRDPSLCFQPLWYHECLSLSSRFDINIRVVSKTNNQSFCHSLWLFEVLVFKIEKSEIVQTARWIFLIGNCKI